MNAFVGSSNIKYIEMYNNALSDLQPLTFASLESSLISLVISFNKLKLIRYGTFNRLVRLEELHLEYNEIESIESNSFEEMSNLKTIYLNNNNLSQFTSTFSNLFNLKTIFMQNNEQLMSLEARSFNELAYVDFI